LNQGLDCGAAIGRIWHRLCHTPRGIKVFFASFLVTTQQPMKGRKVNRIKKFFFEKKNQKTFAPLRAVVEQPPAKN
jgi:hypothetical protein